MTKKRIVFLSYHYPPDQSAGSVRSNFLVNELVKNDNLLEVHVFCSYPYRYGKTNINDLKKNR